MTKKVSSERRPYAIYLIKRNKQRLHNGYHTRHEMDKEIKRLIKHNYEVDSMGGQLIMTDDGMMIQTQTVMSRIKRKKTHGKRNR